MSIVHVFLACALLLAVFAIGTYLVRRSRWLRRFATLPTGERAGLPIEVRRIQRLSTHTTLFVVARGTEEFLVIESARQIAVQSVLRSSNKESEP